MPRSFPSNEEGAGGKKQQENNGNNPPCYDIIFLKESYMDGLFKRIEAILGTEKAIIWFNEDNPMLGDVSPLYMLRMGRRTRLEKFVSEAEESNNLSPLDSLLYF